MKVRELIAALQKLPPDAEVHVPFDMSDEYGYEECTSARLNPPWTLWSHTPHGVVTLDAHGRSQDAKAAG